MKTRIAQILTAFTVSISSLLSLGLPLASAATYTCTWITAGPDNNFSNAANWLGCNGAAPQIADVNNLVFTNVSEEVVNDLVGAAFNTITFDGSVSSTYPVISGNAFTLAGGIIAQDTDTVSAIIENTITLGASNAFLDMTTGNTLTLSGILNGTGGLTKTNTGGKIVLSGLNTYTGVNTFHNVTVVATKTASLGSNAGGTTIGAGADLAISNGDNCETASLTISENLTLTGASSTASTPNSPQRPKLFVGCIYQGLFSSYGISARAGETVNMTGTITNDSDVTFATSATTATISGIYGGLNKMTVLPGSQGKLVIASSSNLNVNQHPNGTYTAESLAVTLSDTQSSSIDLIANTTLTLDGSRDGVGVLKDAILKGTGSTGDLTVATGGTVAPGHSPGCLNTGNVTLLGTYQAEIGGTTACSGYDQMRVTGTINLTSGTLVTSLYGGFVPAVGQSYTIIDNDGADAITGTFAGLAEGATITVTGVTYRISYVGGTGNDVVLTVTAVDAGQLPTTPNTGLKLIMAHPLISLAITTLAAGYLVYLSRRFNLAKTR